MFFRFRRAFGALFECEGLLPSVLVLVLVLVLDFLGTIVVLVSSSYLLDCILTGLPFYVYRPCVLFLRRQSRVLSLCILCLVGVLIGRFPSVLHSFPLADILLASTVVSNSSPF